MSDQELNQLRDRIDSTITTPPFDDLLERGTRRRRTRLGLTAGTLAVVVGGAGLGLGQSLTDNTSTPPTNPAPIERLSADDILDDPDSVPVWYQETDSGTTYATWEAPCDTGVVAYCELALAWSDDGWATRHSMVLNPEAYDFALFGGQLVVWPTIDGPTFLIQSNGDQVPVSEPTKARPASDTGLILPVAGDEPRWSVVDAETAESHDVLMPSGIEVVDLIRLPDGGLRAFGTATAGDWEVADSHDGGRTWRRHVVPIEAASAFLIQGKSNILAIEQTSPHNTYLVSSDQGRTWTRLRTAEFYNPTCFTTTDDNMFFVNLGELWVTSDSTWQRFERITGVPDLGCISSSGNHLSVLLADRIGVLVSDDSGRTWSEPDRIR